MQTLQTGPTATDAAATTFFDEDGYLIDHQLWDEYVGQAIALKEGVAPLNDRHWRVIKHIRARFLLLGGLPSLRRTCRATALSKAEIYELFGGCLVIWRIAGLPNPGEEAKTYLN